MTPGPDQGLIFSCSCGALTGRISERGARTGTHVVCFCHDCRAAQLYFGQPDPAPGPVNVFQMSPEEITFLSGKDNLSCMRLSPKGMLRWYAKCCNAPLATTSPTPKIPFAGFDVNRLRAPESIGPVTTRGFVPRGNGKQSHEMLQYAAWGLVKRVVPSRLVGRWKNTPFFDVATGTPCVTPTTLSKSERAALYP